MPLENLQPECTVATAAPRAHLRTGPWLHLVFPFLLLLVIARLLWLNDGRFIYTLDDPYIHLAYSEGLAKLHPGLNPAEAAAPSSSILWPFLLAPFAPFAIHELVPLLINIALGALTMHLLLLCLTASDVLEWPAPSRRVFLAGIVLAAATLFVSLTLMGMEHMLQCSCALAAVYGAIRLVRAGQAPRWWLFVLVLNPLVRYESSVMLIGGCFLLLACRRYRTVALLLLAVTLLLSAYSAWLLHLGLAPLPSSVLVKLGVAGENAPPILLRPLYNALQSLYQGAAWSFWLIAGLAVAALMNHGRDRKNARFLIMMLLVLGSYAAAGRWDPRYFAFLLVFMVASAFYAFAPAFLGAHSTALRLRNGTAGLFLLLGLLASLDLLQSAPVASNNIYQQQYQMHRFVTEYFKAPVAVNDLGWVAYRNPHYVLDLWGLGSEEARKMRQAKAPGWVDQLTTRHEVGLAMIYTAWFGDALPKKWTKLATLQLAGKRVSAGGSSVDFYATGEGNIQQLHEHLRAFATSLPPAVKLHMHP